MDWADGFYSTTGRWWGAAESGITQRDHDRVALVRAFCAAQAVAMLELGCGYGNTAAAAACDGFRVTGVDISTRLEFARQHANVGAPDSLRFVRADFRLLLEGTGLALAAACVAGTPRILTSSQDAPPGQSPLVQRLHDLGKPAWATADTLYGDISPDHPREDLAGLVRLGIDSRRRAGAGRRRSPEVTLRVPVGGQPGEAAIMDS